MLFVTHNFLEDMGLVLCVAALATVVCQWLRQPLVLGYLVAGMVVGPNVPGLYANMERVHLVSELGVTVLVFSIGLEFNFRRLVRLAPTAGIVAVIQCASMIGLGYLVGRLTGWTPWESLVTGGVLSISGAVIVAKAFEEAEVDARVRELVFGVVLCEDVIAILLLAVFITIANGGVMSFRELSIGAVTRLLGQPGSESDRLCRDDGGQGRGDRGRMALMSTSPRPHERENFGNRRARDQPPPRAPAQCGEHRRVAGARRLRRTRGRKPKGDDHGYDQTNTRRCDHRPPVPRELRASGHR